MRIAVFTNQFPGRLNTFFARDMRALIEAGIEPHIYAVYPLDAAHWPLVPLLQPDVLPRSHVHHLRPRDVARGLSVLDPSALWRAVRLVSASARHGPVAFAKAAYAAAFAQRLSVVSQGQRFDHVLAYWGNYAASAAYLFHAATQPDVPFSMIVHARMDLYRHRANLPQKLQYADNVFVVCEFNRGYLREHYPTLYPRVAERIHVHHLGMPLDTVAFDPDGRPPAQLLSVGHLERLKGTANLLSAFAALRSGSTPPRLDLIGGGPEEPALRRQATRLGVADRVRFRGWLPPDLVLDEMRRATLLVHPSIAPDAMPTVVKEAMAVGTPVVASHLAGIPEMLDHGRCGVLVAPGDVPALTAAIAGLLDDAARRRSLAIAARAHMERTFDLWRNGRVLADRLRATTRRRS